MFASVFFAEILHFRHDLRRRGYREENIFMARLADQAERYEDMVNFMRNVADIGLCWLNAYTVDDG